MQGWKAGLEPWNTEIMKTRKEKLRDFVRLMTSEAKQKGKRSKMVAASTRLERQDQSLCITACQDEPKRQSGFKSTPCHTQVSLGHLNVYFLVCEHR